MSNGKQAARPATGVAQTLEAAPDKTASASNEDEYSEDEAVDMADLVALVMRNNELLEVLAGPAMRKLERQDLLDGAKEAGAPLPANVSVWFRQVATDELEADDAVRNQVRRACQGVAAPPGAAKPPTPKQLAALSWKGLNKAEKAAMKEYYEAWMDSLADGEEGNDEAGPA